MKKNLMMILAAVATSAAIPFSAWGADPVAKIGDNNYSTLAEAFAAANAAGTATITMIDDYTLVGNIGVTVNSGSNITLDLNGHTISQTGPMAGAGYLIKNQGTLTLKDSTDTAKNGTGAGKMTTSSENPDTGDIPTYANNLISNYGTLTIESGNYKSLTNAGFASFVVDNYSGGTANIAGGKLSNNAEYAYVVRMFLNSTTAENVLNISSGIIEGSYAVWMQYPNSNANKASLNVTGGTITATGGFAVYAGGNDACDASNIDVSFSGGTVGGRGVRLHTGSTAFNSIEVTGGNYAGFSVGEANESFISGGTFGEPVNEAYCAEGYKPTERDSVTGLYTVERDVPPVVFSVPTTNLLGAIKIESNTASNLYVAVPFEGFEADGAARKAKDVVHPANLTAETKMYVYDKTSDSHDVYKVASGAWAPAVKVTINSNNAATLDAASLDRAVPAGTGVLVARANAGDNVYVYGQIPGTTVNPEPFASGQTFVAPPYTNATVEVSGVKYIDLNASTWTGVQAAQQDRKLISGADFIQFRDASNRLIKFYYDGTSWSLQPTYAKLAAYQPYVEGGKALVPQGTAFWYCSSVGGAKVEWK